MRLSCTILMTLRWQRQLLQMQPTKMHGSSACPALVVSSRRVCCLRRQSEVQWYDAFDVCCCIREYRGRPNANTAMLAQLHTGFPRSAE